MKRTLLALLLLAVPAISDVTTRPLGGAKAVPPGPPAGVPVLECPCWTRAKLDAAMNCGVGKSWISSCGAQYSLLVQCVPAPVVFTGWFVAPQAGGSCIYDADGVGPPWDVSLTISADEWQICKDSMVYHPVYPLTCPK